MSWGEVFKITSCRVVVIGKVASLVGATVSITDGVATTTGIFGSDLVLSFELASRKTYTVSAGGFSKVIKPKAGDFLEVELGAFDRLWLYDKGWTDWRIHGGFFRSDNNVTCPGSQSQFTSYDSGMYAAPCIYSGKLIDVTDYNTLWLQTVDDMLQPNGTNMVFLASNIADPGTNVANRKFKYSRKARGVWMPMDVSGVSGEYRIQIFGTDGANNQNVSIYKMYLSKDKVTTLIPPTASLGTDNALTGTFSGGSVSASSIAGNTWEPWRAIYRRDTYDPAWNYGNAWMSLPSDSAPWYKVTFGIAKVANVVRVDQYYSTDRCASTFVLEGSNDDAIWTTLCTKTDCSTVNSSCYVYFDNKIAYKYYRLRFSGKTGTYYSMTSFDLMYTDNINFAYTDLNRKEG